MIRVLIEVYPMGQTPPRKVAELSIARIDESEGTRTYECKLTGKKLDETPIAAIGRLDGFDPARGAVALVGDAIRMLLKDEGVTVEEAARVLGRKGGVKGGKSRAKALPKKRRKEIGKKAAGARWNGGTHPETTP